MKRIIEMTSATAIGPAGCRRRCRLFLFLSLPFFRAILFVCLFVFFLGLRIKSSGSAPFRRPSERPSDGKSIKEKEKQTKEKEKKRKTIFKREIG